MKTSADAVPHHLIIDRCYVHGDAKIGGRRGVALNARHAAVIDSYLSDFKEVGADSQAVSRLERPRAVQDREQLPRSEPARTSCSAARIRRFPDLVPVRHRDRPQPPREAAALEGKGDPDVRGHRVDRQEPLRAEERAARARRRQSVRVQLAAGAERVLDSLHGAQSGRRRAVVDDRRRDVHEQPRPACRRRHQHARARRQPSQPAGAAHHDAEQRVPRRGRHVGQRAAVPAARRRRATSPSITTPRSRPAASCLAATMRPTPDSSSRTTSCMRNENGIIGRAPAKAPTRSRATSPTRSFRRNVIVGGNGGPVSDRTTSSRHRCRMRDWRSRATGTSA